MKKNIEDFYNKFIYLCKKSVSFKNLTTIGIGGCAKVFCELKNKKELVRVIKYLNRNEIKYFIIGCGSNLLCSDYGFDGVVIKLKGKFANHRIKRSEARFGAGVNLFVMNEILRQSGLCGMEFSYGIPASVGGATAMNAGAFGECFSDKIKWVKILINNKIKKINIKNCDFSYRNSIFLKNNLIITEICLKLKYESPTIIKKKQMENLSWRKVHQPYEFRSAGSVFKRCADFVPAKAIDELGMKGMEMGDAQISKIHSGFIVNLGSATCQDVLNLISYICSKVKEQFGEELELEINLIGDNI